MILTERNIIHLKYNPTLLPLAPNYQIDFPTENIDSDTTLGTLQSYNGGVTLPSDEDVAIRGRIGNKRAYGGQFRITNQLGKPSIRAIKLSAAQTFRSTNKAE